MVQSCELAVYETSFVKEWAVSAISPVAEWETSLVGWVPILFGRLYIFGVGYSSLHSRLEAPEICWRFFLGFLTSSNIDILRPYLLFVLRERR